MSGILDSLFRLVPVEDANVSTAEAPEQMQVQQTQVQQMQVQQTPVQQSPVQVDNAIIPDMVQSNSAVQTSVSESVQGDSPEDARITKDVLQEALADRDRVIADLNAKVDQLIKYGAAKQSNQSIETQQLPVVPDAPSDYVPLKDMDFSNDGKF